MLESKSTKVPSEGYQKLEKQFRRMGLLDHALHVLSWDEAVVMPPGGGEYRACSMAELKVMRHEILTSSEIVKNLEAALSSRETLSDWQAANLKEMFREVRMAKAVSSHVVESLSVASSRSEQAWRRCRKENNFKDFLPYQAEVLNWVREEASMIGAALDLSLYDSCLEQFNPGLRSKQVAEVFSDVRQFLPGLVNQVIQKQSAHPERYGNFPDNVNFSTEKQKEFSLEVMKILGFQMENGRLDTSHHPFCGGSPEDVRITTRYRNKDFTDSLMSVIHESGHASYEQGLPRTLAVQPVELAMGMSVHESQSLLFEMHVGRSPEFVSHLIPIMKKYFSPLPEQNWNNIYHYFTKVEKSLFRVEADEVTYPLHVILRYDIEHDLIEGKMQLKDLPEVWNEKMQSLLGISTLGNDHDGCMQDVHWPSGAFGYFPSYSLGSFVAAQLMEKMRVDLLHVKQDLASGNLQPLRHWLGKKIWKHGRSLTIDQLLAQATGEPLSATAFHRHVVDRYLEV